mmetsp:Transcript_17433/g.37856  ORF Transcript_17433/g.37856 Transcript_17433/m.37856 type:complete len:208 (+) Transcript_17433:103-726(+)
MQKLQGAWGAGSAPIVNAAAQRAAGAPDGNVAPGDGVGVSAGDADAPSNTAPSSSPKSEAPSSTSAAAGSANKTQGSNANPRSQRPSTSRSARAGAGQGKAAEKSNGSVAGSLASAGRFNVDEAAHELNRAWQDTLSQLRQPGTNEASATQSQRPFVYRGSASSSGARESKSDFEAMMRATRPSKSSAEFKSSAKQQPAALNTNPKR